MIYSFALCLSILFYFLSCSSLSLLFLSSSLTLSITPSLFPTLSHIFHHFVSSSLFHSFSSLTLSLSFSTTDTPPLTTLEGVRFMDPRHAHYLGIRQCRGGSVSQSILHIKPHTNSFNHSITHTMTRVTQVKEETYANVKSMTGKLDTQIVPVITGFIGKPVIFNSCKTMIPLCICSCLRCYLFLSSFPFSFLSSPISNSDLFTLL